MLAIKNLAAEVNSVDKLYQYKKIAAYNGNALSVVQVADRTLDFHVHEHSDELFCVLEGSFEIETDDGLQRLNAGELTVVPRGTRHRPVVGALCKFLMVELDGTLNKSNSGDQYEEA